MQYSDFLNHKISRLGFGAMRLPMLENDEVDTALFGEMIDYAYAHGVNYFDTAWPYTNGRSELVLGQCLRKYPRESYYLADKFPGHMYYDSYDAESIFEAQLRKCGVDYFDFYLLHNLNDTSCDVYTDPRWNILPYLKKQKELGRIRHLGFSVHATLECLSRFLDYCSEHDFPVEFVQMQLNYLDWTLQDAKATYDLLVSRGIPVVVMEPVRGGMLVQLKEEDAHHLHALEPDRSIPSWAFRWLMRLPNAAVILSGMSNLEQVKDNVRTFEECSALTDEQADLMQKIAQSLMKRVPCTNCRYCVKSCPMGIDIPFMIRAYNDLHFQLSQTVPMILHSTPAEHMPSACLACGACSAMCPQRIDIPHYMKEVAELLLKVPDWGEMCKLRTEAMNKLKY